MLVGVDSTKYPGGPDHDAAWALDEARRSGLDGVLFRSITELSPKLDHAEVRDVAAHARSLGLRIEAGIGKVNPFSTPEAPAIRALGGGDYRLALTRMIEAAAAGGIHELWSALCNYQFGLAACGVYAFDRFRTDVDWPEQLAATMAFLRSLAPVLRAHGTHLNIETHEEITSFELLRIVEEVGADVIGITFDSANVAVRGESPVAAARRVSPHVRATHIRDVALIEVPDGLARFLLPVGDGVIDWPALLAALAAEAPKDHELMLSIEGVTTVRAEMAIPFLDRRWQAGHPDLVAAELIELIGLERAYRGRVADGEAPGAARLREKVTPEEAKQFAQKSAAALRQEIGRLSAAA
jgi:sugar phosphate isomerase/epimerase